jgi:hypothetical protein
MLLKLTVSYLLSQSKERANLFLDIPSEKCHPNLFLQKKEIKKFVDFCKKTAFSLKRFAQNTENSEEREYNTGRKMNLGHYFSNK